MLSLVVTKHNYGETVSVLCCLREVGFLPLQEKDYFLTVTNITDGFSFSCKKYRYFWQFILGVFTTIPLVQSPAHFYP
jgi:hypothetical protein